MTEKQRLLAAMGGQPVDRAPIWLREGMAVLEAPAPAGDFQCGWQADHVYRDLMAYVAPHACAIQGWGVAAFNRLLMVPPACVQYLPRQDLPGARRSEYHIHTPKGDLVGIYETRCGQHTSWHVKHPVESPQDLAKLASVPFSLDPAHITSAISAYHRANQGVGDRGVSRLNVSSPIVVLSACMPFQLFLELSLTEEAWFRELCEEITRRELLVLEALFAQAPNLETTINIGGSEQCTPPMMSPASFDNFVVPYEARLIQRVKKQGLPVNIHCHGKVRYALPRMIAMGADSTDPVEPPPAGDVTYAQARQIVGDRLTLVGNLEFDMLEHAEPAQIRRHVREVLSMGNRRLILAASAGPISAVSPRLAGNYKAWIDAALEFGAAH